MCGSGERWIYDKVPVIMCAHTYISCFLEDTCTHQDALTGVSLLHTRCVLFQGLNDTDIGTRVTLKHQAVLQVRQAIISILIKKLSVWRGQLDLSCLVISSTEAAALEVPVVQVPTINVCLRVVSDKRVARYQNIYIIYIYKSY